MPNPTWISYRERTNGENSDGYPDVSNRPARTIWSNFTNQHDKTGTHKSDLTDGLCVMETDSYTGNATDNTDITLTNTDLDIKFLRVWSEESAFFWYMTEDLDSEEVNLSLSSQGYLAAGRIKSIGTGTFRIGDSDDVNKNGSTYYYTAYGVIAEEGGGS